MSKEKRTFADKDTATSRKYDAEDLNTHDANCHHVKRDLKLLYFSGLVFSEVAAARACDGYDLSENPAAYSRI